MAIGTDQLWVVVMQDTQPSVYSYDTTAPDQVFLTEADAQAHCDLQNAELKLAIERNTWMRHYIYMVSTLSDRMEEILSQARDQGADNADRGHAY